MPLNEHPRSAKKFCTNPLLSLQPNSGRVILTLVVPRLSSRSNKTKTWVLMLGIVAVIGLDLGFTLLIGSENSPPLAVDTTVRDLRADRTRQVLTEPQAASTDGDTIAESPIRPAAPHSVKTGVLRSGNRPPAAREIDVTVARTRSRPAPTFPQTRFEPTIIKTRYAATPPPAFGPYVVTTTDNISYRSAEVRREKKRSFVSKVSPVVKKPWQWMRSLVSKLR